MLTRHGVYNKHLAVMASKKDMRREDLSMSRLDQAYNHALC